MKKISWKHDDVEVYYNGNKYIIDVEKSGRYRINSNESLLLPEGETEIDADIEGNPARLTNGYLNDFILNTKKSDNQIEIIIPEDMEIKSEPSVSSRHVCPCGNPVELRWDDTSIIMENMCVGQEYSLEVNLRDTEKNRDDSISIETIKHSSGTLDLEGIKRDITVKTPEDISGKIVVEESLDISRRYSSRFEVRKEEEYTELNLPLPDRIKMDDSNRKPTLNPTIKFLPDVSGPDIKDEKEDVSSDFAELTNISNRTSLLFTTPSWLPIKKFNLESNSETILSSNKAPKKLEEIYSSTIKYKISTSRKNGSYKDLLSKVENINPCGEVSHDINLKEAIDYFNIDIFIRNKNNNNFRVILEYPEEDLKLSYMISDNVSKIRVKREKLKIYLKSEDDGSVIKELSFSKNEIPYVKSLYFDLEK